MMRAQLDHLPGVARSGNAVVRVIPY
ncbi:hypothetical protein [Nocardiopsis rhodophaea]